MFCMYFVWRFGRKVDLEIIFGQLNLGKGSMLDN